MTARGRAVLIAGPTASGKSALAVEVARALRGVVVNADSQQVRAGWRVLTARPTEAEMAGVAHHLYGHVALGAPYSVGHWLADLTPLLAGPPPVIVGGTGLYFAALTGGLAPIPPVPDAVRDAGAAELERIGLAAFAAALAARDPETAAALDLANPRRVLRAWEVLEATGTGLAEWQRRTPAPLLDLADCAAVVLAPDRAGLYARCDARFGRMLAAGALDEARAVMALGLAPDAPGLGAVGAPELFAHLRGEITLDEAATRARTATRRYAKRQMTWMRNRMTGWTWLAAPSCDRVLELATGRD